MPSCAASPHAACPSAGTSWASCSPPSSCATSPPGEEEETELDGRRSGPATAEERKEQRKQERALIDAALEEVLPEAFAAVREADGGARSASATTTSSWSGDGAHRGAIAEMKTGEGKTLWRRWLPTSTG